MNTTNILYAIAALGGMGILLGALLGMADKLFAVQVDERVALVRENVAGANCGACGISYGSWNFYRYVHPGAKEIIRISAEVHIL